MGDCRKLAPDIERRPVRFARSRAPRNAGTAQPNGATIELRQQTPGCLQVFRHLRITGPFLFCALSLSGQAGNSGDRFGYGTAGQRPSPCSPGQSFLALDQTLGENLYRCGPSGWVRRILTGTLAVRGVVGNGTTDDTSALNRALAIAGTRLTLPCGIFKISGRGLTITADDVVLEGQGECSVIQPEGLSNSANVIDMDKHSNVVLRNFKIDNSLISDGQHTGTAIFAGDIEAGVQSGVVVDHIAIVHSQLLGIGVGSKAGTNRDAQITGNYISQDTCVTAACGNGIDTGSAGVREGFTIQGNTIWYPSPIVSGVGSTGPAGGTGIFVGHGVTRGFSIDDNIVWNAPANAIAIYARPFDPADTPIGALDHALTGNSSINSGSAGIAIYGGTNISVLGGSVVNPGMDSSEGGYTPAGILITHGVSAFGPSDSATEYLRSPKRLI